MTQPDFCKLCAELVNELHGYKVSNPNHATELIDRARTALATTPPEPPTDTELDALEEKLWHEYKTCGYLGEEFMYDYSFKHALSDYRTVLERWGTPQPEPGKPTAWMYQGEDDFDGIRWRENWDVTIDEKLARFKSGNKEPIPLFKAHDLAPPPEPPTDEELLKAVRHLYGDQISANMGADDDLLTARAVLERWEK